MRRDTMRPTKIISGGQTGADQGGLVAAKQLGIPTGGWMPFGFLTEVGPRRELAGAYGMLEHASHRYPPRTAANVQSSDGTVWIGRTNSRGYLCTRNAADRYGKPFAVVTTPDELREFVSHFRIQVLNVAGNSASKDPTIHRRTAELVIAAFQNV